MSEVVVAAALSAFAGALVAPLLGRRIESYQWRRDRRADAYASFLSAYQSFAIFAPHLVQGEGEHRDLLRELNKARAQVDILGTRQVGKQAAVIVSLQMHARGTPHSATEDVLAEEEAELIRLMRADVRTLERRES